MSHRAVCQDLDCGRVWRENCADCACDTADKHRRETGHAVSLELITERTWSDIKKMTGLAHPVLFQKRRRP